MQIEVQQIPKLDLDQLEGFDLMDGEDEEHPGEEIAALVPFKQIRLKS